MADVLNRATKKPRRSVNTPDFPVADYIINPDLSAVAGLPGKHWKITGDAVSAMNQTEMDAVDAQEALDQADSEKGTAKTAFDAQRVLRALAGVMMDEINTLRAEHSLDPRTATQLRTAIRAKVDAG